MYIGKYRGEEVELTFSQSRSGEITLLEFRLFDNYVDWTTLPEDAQRALLEKGEEVEFTYNYSDDGERD